MRKLDSFTIARMFVYSLEGAGIVWDCIDIMPYAHADLRDSLCLIDSLELFRSKLKTHLFKAAFVNYL